MAMKQFIKTIKFWILASLVFFSFFEAKAQECSEMKRNWALNEGPYSLKLAKVSLSRKNKEKILVAVIDSGIDKSHPCLTSSVLIKDLSQKRSDQLKSRRPQSTPDLDPVGHGTHIAGIIEGVVKSVYQDDEPIALLSISTYRREEEDHSIEYSIRAFEMAIAQGARIINYSGGGEEFSKEEYRVLKKAEKLGILVVTAAGNKGNDISVKGQEFYPASYHLKNILSVASIGKEGGIDPISNRGKGVHLAAPGVGILSTVPGGGFQEKSGTSQATAFVTGVAALILTERPDLKAERIKELILSSVKKQDDLKGFVDSGGGLNAEEVFRRFKQN